MPVASAGVQGRYAYTHHDVRVHEMRLNYVFRQLTVFRKLGVHAYYNGEATVRFGNGASGFGKIRCTTNVNMPDFLYWLDSSGREHMKRVPPK